MSPSTVLVYGGTKRSNNEHQKNDNNVIGVVSTNPHNLMNDDIGVAVALRGSSVKLLVQ